MTGRSALSKQCLVVIMGVSSSFGMAVCLAQDNQQEAAINQSSEFTYNDDWALVSAPPPPGPYQSINVDPRVPGQEDNIPSPTGGHESHVPQAGQQPPDRLVDLPPPAAGRQLPGRLMDLPPPAAATGEYGEPPPYGYNRPPGYNIPHERRQSRPAPGQDYFRSSPLPYPAYQGSGYAASPWTSAPPAVEEEEVPPPPVYDRMTTPYQGRQYYRDGMR